MSAVAATASGWTVDDFLAWERGQAGRHEFIGGCIYAMAPTRVAHGASAAQLAVRLSDQIEPPCLTLVEGPMLRVADAAFVPDVWVVCSQPDPDATELDDADLIIEVLSPGNRPGEMEAKRVAYLTLPSLVAYLVVDGERYEAWTRVSDVGPWQCESCKAGEFTVSLHGRDIRI